MTIDVYNAEIPNQIRNMARIISLIIFTPFSVDHKNNIITTVRKRHDPIKIITVRFVKVLQNETPVFPNYFLDV
ncbi:MAG: hypothetical protein DRO01_00065 [Thermoproteota archaeon]|nr:MAG: hypothetical protein DRO01_00065 [Candidatus Korarchaeota archaeon]